MSLRYDYLLLFGTFFGQRYRCILIAGLQCARIPVIQFMGNIMTVTTLGEACHHTGRVRHTMAALAGWYSLVLVLMAGNTQDSLVLGIAAGKHLVRTLVTGSTHLVRCIRCHVDGCRHMGLVTFFTIGCHHFRVVRFMALCAKRNLAVNVVAETASQGGVFALDLFELDDLIGMAGQTLIGDVVCKFDYFRSMRIVVTPQTSGQVVVSLAGMALATDRDNLFH